ncbi:dihydrofolate reductase [Arthrobotrys musiformis]|uniref:Dihydrofolate reductase n=1 Tax=Arthrobotrys musiformis TaxID=47236 RepID=A0AAV9W5J4_9PEZI
MTAGSHEITVMESRILEAVLGITLITRVEGSTRAPSWARVTPAQMEMRSLPLRASRVASTERISETIWGLQPRMTMSESWAPRVLSPAMIVTGGEDDGERVDCGKILARRVADSGRFTQATKEVGRWVGVEGVEGNGDGGAVLESVARAARMPESTATPIVPQPTKPRERPGTFFSDIFFYFICLFLSKKYRIGEVVGKSEYKRQKRDFSAAKVGIGHNLRRRRSPADSKKISWQRDDICTFPTSSPLLYTSSPQHIFIYKMTHQIAIIVATTPRPALAIGKSLTNDMPWPRLKSELSYFYRVTRRVPPPTTNQKYINAVIMGRKTWDSLPAQYKPLSGRINVVISRSPPASPTCGEIWAGDIEGAVRVLKQRYSGDEGEMLNRVFIIGGSQIYKLAMGVERGSEAFATCILQTTVLTPDYAAEEGVDVFFPEIDEGEWRRGGFGPVG